MRVDEHIHARHQHTVDRSAPAALPALEIFDLVERPELRHVNARS
jgi:hypothetical protein